MSSENIGGFFATLGLQVDKNSFEQGDKALSSSTNKISALVGTARNVAAVIGVLGGYATATAKIEAVELRNAAALGVDVERLNDWKTAAKLVGVNANGLIGAMQKLETSYQALKSGTADTELAKNLSYLGLNYNEVADLSADERLKVVLQTAKAMEDQGRAAYLINKVLGQTGLDFYESMKLSGMTVDELLKKAGSINLTDKADYEKANNFSNELNETKARMEALSKSFGSKLSADFTPLLEKLNSWLESNGPKIVDDLNKITGYILRITDKIAPIVEEAGKAAVDTADSLLSGVTQMLEGDIVGGGKTAVLGSDFDTMKEKASKYYGDDVMGAINAAARTMPGVNIVTHATDTVLHKAGLMPDSEYNLYWGEENSNPAPSVNTTPKTDKNKTENKTVIVPVETKKVVEPVETKTIVPPAENKTEQKKDNLSFWQKFSDWWNDTVDNAKDKLGLSNGKKQNKVNDGIIRPNGQITQVSSEDWVFAVRNLGDLAGSFMPKPYQLNSNYSAPQTFTITQNFNISGSNLMPQVIKQQAYEGTQNAITENMAKTARIMQLMPGLK